MSSTIGSERVPKFRSHSSEFGRAHYSWKINASLYRRALAAVRTLQEIDAPDIYQHAIAKDLVGIQASDIHLADKPIELLRPLFGNKNVAIEVWEFPEMSTRSHGGDPRLNQVGILQKFDHVWCGSTFTANTMQSYDINAIYLPPPVAHFVSEEQESLSNIPAVFLDSSSVGGEVVYHDLSEVLNSGKSIYLSVLAPYDRRKNLKNLIEGFLESAAQKDGILLIKLVIDNITTHVGNISELLKIEYGIDKSSEKVVFIGSYLSNEQMCALYKSCTFFVSAASAEGLNLPLIEAMTQGCPVIAPDNTAMHDYIAPNHAIVIESGRKPAVGPIHALHKFMDTTHFPATKAQVIDAFDRASSLRQADRTRLGKAGAQVVKSVFGLDAFKARLQEFERGL
jgi:glycosyltransferase involved in cell wall biosynthesis